MTPGIQHAKPFKGHFVLEVASDVIVIEDITMPNEDGWTPLHACCHSFTTAPAALKVIAHYQEMGCILDSKTINGPGVYNGGWTALHMACAYGLESVAFALLDAGADTNLRNDHDMTALLESCYRGYKAITQALLNNEKTDINHVPDEAKFRGQPFSRPHPTTALGECARCGFSDLVLLLLNFGCDVNTTNSKGWSALHEACYCNQLSTVKTLLKEGADATLRTEKNALPYHLAVTESIKGYLREFGGKGAIPEEGDMPEGLFQGLGWGGGGWTFNFGDDEDDEDYQIGEDEDNDDDNDVGVFDDAEEEEAKEEEGELINRGGLLGDLPPLTPSPNKKSEKEKSSKKKKKKKKKDKDGKKNRKEGGKLPDYSDIDDSSVPEKFKCQIGKRILLQPMVTPSSFHFESTLLVEWFKRQGSVCPISGVPLNANECRPDRELAGEIRNWVENVRNEKREERELAGKRQKDKVGVGQGGTSNDDEMYDF